jgi:hypothetical protein
MINPSPGSSAAAFGNLFGMACVARLGLTKTRFLSPDECLTVFSGDSSHWRGYKEVALFFCTARTPSGRRTPDDFFGTARAHAPSTGFVRVSLPDFDDVASNGSDLPYLWRSYRKRPTGNTSKSLAIESCIVMDVDCHMGHLVGRNGAPGRQSSSFMVSTTFSLSED